MVARSVEVDDAMSGLPRRMLKRSEYEQLVALGAFADERVELVFGEILPMSPQGTAHSWTVNLFNRRLTSALGDRATVRAHSPIQAAGESLPEPDVAVYPLAEDRPDQHPKDILLVIEVADSSRKKDMGVKARLYALTGIPTYWAVDLVQRSVRVHADPVDGEYRLITTLVPGQGAELVVPTHPDVHIPVDDLFPAR